MATKTNRKHSWQHAGATIHPSSHTGDGAWVCFPDGPTGERPVYFMADNKDSMRAQIDAHRRRHARRAAAAAKLTENT